MNLVEAATEAKARVTQINTEIAELQAAIQALQAEKAAIAQDIADLRAFLATKGVQV